LLWLLWNWGGSRFLPRLAWITILFKLPSVTGMTGTCHYAQLFSAEMGVLQTIFCLGWPGTMILLTSACQVTRIIGMSHWHLAHRYLFK
jgi:hypothetical protein